jgi:PAS domain S-box-containing protein
MISKRKILVLYIILGFSWYNITESFIPHDWHVMMDTVFLCACTLIVAILLNNRENQILRQQAQLHSQEQDYRYLFINNPQAMSVMDWETRRFLEVNDMMVAKYGYSREEFLGLTINDIHPQHEIPRIQESLKLPYDQQKHIKGGQWQHRIKDGTIIEVEGIGHRLLYHGRKATLVVATDVTEQNALFRHLAEREAQLTHIFENLDHAIMSINFRAPHLNVVSPAIERITGYSPQQILENPSFWVSIIHPDDFEAVIQAFHMTLRNGKRDIKYRIIDAQGNGRWVHDRLWVVRDEYGQPLRFDAIFSDITDMKKREEERLETEKLQVAFNKELEARHWRNRFMSMVSHETRNPLAVIGMSLSLLETYYERLSTEKREEQFRKIYRQLSQLQDLADDVSTLIQTEETAPIFQTKVLNIADLCRHVSDEAHDYALATQTITYEPDLNNTAVNIEGDEKLLNRALNNLMKNACKYTSAHGNITLGLRQENNEVLIWVKDNGIGIPTQDLPNIFDEFYRASNVGKLHGTGFGLAITKQAIELHHGRIAVESEVGKGTTFRVYLPLRTITD